MKQARVQPKKLWLFRAIAVVIAVVLTLAALELTFRFFINFSNTACGVMQADPELGVRFKPHLDTTVTTTAFTMRLVTNARGLRDRDYGPKEAGEFRILALGDSFTEGAVPELEQALVKHLERLLNARATNTTFAVINAGVSGYGARQERIMLERQLDLEPDLVLVFFYQNDPESDYEQRDGPTVTVVDDCAVSRASLNRAPTLNEWLLAHSRLYYFVKVIAPNYQAVKSIAYPVRNALVKLGLAEPPRLRYFVLEAAYDEHAQQAWNASLAELARIKGITETHGIPLAIVMIPMKFQVYDNLWEEYRSRNMIPEGTYDFSKPSSILGAFAHEHGVGFIDLLPLLRAKIGQGALKEPVYYENDPHFNAYGNQIVAELVHQELARQGLVVHG
jgi:lysophospholipase L1-like esterase